MEFVGNKGAVCHAQDPPAWRSGWRPVEPAPYSGWLRHEPSERQMGYVKTAMLMAAMTALFMGIGYLIGGSGGALIALVVAAAMNVFTWWNSDRMVLRMHNA